MLCISALVSPVIRNSFSSACVIFGVECLTLLVRASTFYCGVVQGPLSLARDGIRKVTGEQVCCLAFANSTVQRLEFICNFFVSAEGA